jgi:hypothetical protein
LIDDPKETEPLEATTPPVEEIAKESAEEESK